VWAQRSAYVSFTDLFVLSFRDRNPDNRMA